MKRVVLALLLAVGSMEPARDAAAHQIIRGDLQIAHPHLEVDFDCRREPVRAGVMLVANTGDVDEQLVGMSITGLGPGYAVSSAAPMTTEDASVQRPAVRVPAHGATGMDLDGVRWIFKGPARGLVEGGMVRGSLQFRRAGRIAVEFMVEAVHRPQGAAAPCGPAAKSAAPGTRHHDA